MTSLPCLVRQQSIMYKQLIGLVSEHPTYIQQHKHMQSSSLFCLVANACV